MATSNNIQGDEPRPTTLERQVQTLTAVVERLTKQNQDLEEQLWQKNAAMGTQEEDQEGTSAEWRNQEGPKGSNALSKLERMNLITDMAPPHIVTEMQIKEWMDLMMNVLRGRVSNNLNDLVHQIDSPFTMFVNSFPLPQKFHMSQIESYDGAKDPLDHLESFKTLMHLQGVADEIMCRAFPNTLKGSCKSLIQ